LPLGRVTSRFRAQALRLQPFLRLLMMKGHLLRKLAAELFTAKKDPQLTE
jgi:hypothetical protein